jgi:hypothetical protein
MRYPDSIYNSAGNMGKSGTKARLAHLRQQALEVTIRQLVLAPVAPIKK